MMGQLRAMAWYEFRMHWRRRTLIVATLSLVILNLMMIWANRDSFSQWAGFQATNVVLPDITPIFWIGIYIVILAFIGPMTADSVPLDRQVGISELLHSLPLPYSTYLIGKIAGMFLSIGWSLLISMVVIGVGAWIIMGAYDLGLFLRMWFLGALPLAILNPTLCLLLAAGQPTRRRAAVIGGIFALGCLIAFSLSASDAMRQIPLTASDYLSLARSPIWRFFMFGGSQSISTTDFAGSIVVGVIQIVVVFGIIWGWIRLKESRA